MNGPAFVTPCDFGDPRAEYRAAREACALFRLDERAHVEISGADRAAFLHNFCTNDIRGLAPGRGREAFLTSVQGKVLAHVFVFAGERSLLLASVPGSAPRIVAHLSRYQINEDVSFADRTAEWGTLLVAGPRAAEVIGQVDHRAADLAPLAQLERGAGEAPALVRRNDFPGVPAFELIAARDRIEGLAEALIRAGAHPAGASAFDALRIEAGFPLYGIDASDANLAQEIGRTAQAISFTKGCYLGQEPIARIDALGHVNRLLSRLRLEGPRVPAPGSDVLDLSEPARPLGTITSAALSYAGGDERAVALAYLRRGHEAPGSGVRVRCGEELVPAVVV